MMLRKFKKLYQEDGKGAQIVLHEYKYHQKQEGHGFIMPSWQGPGRSPGVSKEQKASLCAADAEVAFLEMVLLGYTELLIVSKRSDYVHLPKNMVIGRGKNYCEAYASKGNVSYYCMQRGGKDIIVDAATMPQSKVGAKVDGRRLI